MNPTTPFQRLRRLRTTPQSRSLVRETRLHRGDFIYPLFVVPGSGVRKEVASMPGVFNLSLDEAVEESRKVFDLGIPAVILFGIPEEKDECGSGAFAETGIVQRASAAIKQAVPGLLVIADTCLCEYTGHGHCGMLEEGMWPMTLPWRSSARPRFRRPALGRTGSLRAG